MSSFAGNIFGTKIGIIGGGQLGKMMILEAKKMGIYVAVLDPAENCPAHSICDRHIVAGFDDEAAIRELCDSVDVTTYEFEHINSQILMELEKTGVKIFPTAHSLSIIQDKLEQKKTLKDAGLPVPDFIPVLDEEDINRAAEVFGYPYILKARAGGYDGRGNAVVASWAEAMQALEEMKGNCMAERLINFKMEVSVLACRGQQDELVVYPVAKNTHRDNVLRRTEVPADISPETTQKAVKLAGDVMKRLSGVGMFCVEMFVENDGELLINEVAPRPHNSGHYTIEGCCTNQFENHIRAVVGLPLGDTSLKYPSVMINLLGEDISGNEAGLYNVLRIPSAKIHIYGKEVAACKRKMGHITVTADTLPEARKLADEAEKKLNS